MAETGLNGTAAENAQRLNALLENPETIEALEDAVKRLPELTATIDLVSGFLQNSSRLAENANGIVRTARKAFADENGNGNAGPDAYTQVERVKQYAVAGGRIADELVDPLSDPEKVKAIGELLEMLPRLVALLQMVELFLANSSRFAENINGILGTARKAAEDQWPDIMDRQGLLALPMMLVDLVNNPALNRLLESQVLSDGALHVMDQVAGATVDAHQRAVNSDMRVSRFGAFKALGDPDVQRGLAFTIELSRSLGAMMREQPHPTPSKTERAKKMKAHGA